MNGSNVHKNVSLIQSMYLGMISGEMDSYVWHATTDLSEYCAYMHVLCLK